MIMPFGNLYKFTDKDKWHLFSLEIGGVTRCGLFSKPQMLFRRIGTSVDGGTILPDPPKEEMCEKCFEFLFK